MRGRTIARDSYELQRPWGAPVTRFRMSMLCDMASGQNPFGAWLCSRCVRTRVKIERIARSATPFNPWTSGGWRRLDLVDAVLVEQVLNGV